MALQSTISYGTRLSVRMIPMILFVIAALLIYKLGHHWVSFTNAGANNFSNDLTVDQVTLDQNAIPNGSVSVDARLKEYDALLKVENGAQSTNQEINQVASEPAGTVIAQNNVEQRLLARLRDRRAAMDLREEALRTREALIQAAEAELKEQFTLLAQKQAVLEALEKRRSSAATEELTGLVKTYERMKPRDAARIFEILDDDLLVSVATDMRTQALAGILAEMQPERARILTELIANKNKPSNPIPRSTNSGEGR